MSITLGTVGIVVKDMPKTLNFYRVLGLSIPEEANSEQNFDFEPEGGVVLGFLTEALAAPADPNFVPPASSSLNLQFQCSSPAEVNETYSRLVSAGYASYTEPWDAYWGQRFARVTDPDNRIANFYAHLAPS